MAKRKLDVDADQREANVVKKRHKMITVSGEVPRNIGKLAYLVVDPDFMQVDGEAKSYPILTWARHDEFLPEYDPSATMKNFRQKALLFLSNPLGSLVFNEQTQQWDCNHHMEATFSPKERLVADGFKHSMGNSRGRTAMHCILTELIADERTDNVINIGGGSTSEEPAVREIKFLLSELSDYSSMNETSTAESTSEKESPTRIQPNRAKEIQPRKDDEKIQNIKLKKFVPDLVLETYSGSTVKEKLIVEIKKGIKITTLHEACLKFEMLPPIITQERIYGLIICAKKAVLIEYTMGENGASHRQKHYNFTDSRLLDVVTNLLCDLYYYLKKM